MIVTTDFIQDRRVRKEARTLIQAGYQVTVIASKGLESKDTIKSSTQFPRLRRVSINHICLIQVKVPQRSKLKISKVKIALDMVKCYFPSFLLFLYAAVREKAHIYHCHDIDTLLMGYIASRVNHTKLVYDCHDRYDEIKAEGTFIRAFRIGWKFMERVLIRKTDAVITVCDSFAKILITRYEIDKPLIIYNCPYLHPWKKTSTIREHFNIPVRNKIVLYLGCIATDRGIDLLIDSSQYFLPGIRLVLLGTASDSYRHTLERKITSLSNPGIVHLGGFVPMEEVIQYLMSADITVIPYHDFPNTLPNKLFETMMAGLPIVATGLSAMRKVIEEVDCGIIVEEITPHAFAGAINRTVTDSVLLKRLSTNARRAAELGYNWENESKKLIELYANLALMESNATGQGAKKYNNY